MDQKQLDNNIGNHINTSITAIEETIGRLHHLLNTYSNYLNTDDFYAIKHIIPQLNQAGDILIAAQNYPIETVSDNPDNYIYPTPVDDEKLCPGCGDIDIFSGKYCDNCTGNFAAVSGPNPQF